MPSGSKFDLDIREENSNQSIYKVVLKVNSKGEFYWADLNPDPSKV
ncbi:hypothetical protein [Gottfriedia luciferensis]|nr:hypothetical protein [Gottfriedia luciferensis]